MQVTKSASTRKAYGRATDHAMELASKLSMKDHVQNSIFSMDHGTVELYDKAHSHFKSSKCMYPRLLRGKSWERAS